jgi:UDP-N-acetylmuramoylalanine--D-glutamate ligase
MDAVRSFTDQLFHAEEVRTAVFLAHELAREGQVVLFSPACPSGEGFANYEERGAEFKRAVRDL